MKAHEHPHPPAPAQAHPKGHASAHGHGHDHDHDHDGDHGHDHGHAHGKSRWSRWKHQVTHMVKPHSHEAADKVDSAMESSAEGMRALWLSLAILGATAVFQTVVVLISGSVALLGDTIHNFADAMTALPLGVAFVLGRRVANRTFTYGYGRAEDLAGIFIVLTIAASAALAAYEAIDRLMNPRDISHLGIVSIAAVVGFIGNEWVARYRIRVGRKIGSAALVADGLHARTDGFTSLAVLLGAGGAALGWQLADPIVGLLITAAILLVLKDAAREVFRRLMDSVDPALVDKGEAAVREVAGVREVKELRMRWIGHKLRAEATVEVDGALSVRESHAVSVDVEHALIHAVPRLTAALVHTDPALGPDMDDPHLALAHHMT
ncbi:cation diffusion facilitator family transporter [Streptomyces sp. NBS 14/10]|uniref:cation diffusion facilitator family transporter n=1 Tax=Streptomyces sp. NBS 14/10 TaxID=1945643 RepID=UPI000B7D5250|nr:cation diffusion facilitator family transporter [Streptomyces sp. NBS 14/10]KAK1185651.1 cation diffusion facilitator family transporter [Streptomyces sp. NBS 14/10]